MEELDLRRVLHPIQVMFRTLLTVVAPVPDSMVEYEPEIFDIVGLGLDRIDVIKGGRVWSGIGGDLSHSVVG